MHAANPEPDEALTIMCWQCRALPGGKTLSRRRFQGGLLATAIAPAGAGGDGPAPVDPRMRLAVPPGGPPVVALTLDACMGEADLRILDALEAHAIPATIFVTGLWLQANPAALARLLARPELFSLQNHGAQHIVPVLGAGHVYGLRVAGTAAAVEREVRNGGLAVAAAGAERPAWYRGAAALYSPQAIDLIKAMGWSIAGYSLNADAGASLPANSVNARIVRAQHGDIIIGHINQPRRPSGAGVAAGVVALQQAGVRFVWLDKSKEVLLF